MSLIRGLNHVTLAVSDLERSVVFYEQTLGLSLRKLWPAGAYLEAGAFWLCLSLDPSARTEPYTDYTHMAFDVAQDDFETAVARLKQAKIPAWKNNRSEGDSFYFLDPDGHKLELHVGNLQSRLAAMSSGE